MRNYVSLVGRLGNDPTSREVKRGLNVASFSLAVRTGKGGQDHTSWFRISAWDRACEKAMSMSKGQLVAISGSIQIREYKNKDGEDKISVDVNAREIYAITFTEAKKEPVAEEEIPW